MSAARGAGEDAQSFVARSMSERELQGHVVSAAVALGWLCYHTYDSRRSAEGFPDLTLARRGQVLFVELKAERGKCTDAQLRWLGQLPNARVWRPSCLLSGVVEEALR